jgi:coenzyme F420-reducing hydrogenase delta subunit
VQRDGEFEEYFHEKVESLCISKSRCFFDALTSMASHDQTEIVYMLLNPLFIDRSKITETFFKNKDVKKYKQIVNFYLERVEKVRRRDKDQK